MSFRALRALLCGTALSLAAGAAAAQGQLVVSWWGFNGEKLQANVVEPFQKLCGCELVFETGNNGDRLNKLAARGGAGVDVIFLTDSFSQVGIEQGLFQPVDRSKLSNLGALYELARAPQGDYGPAYTIGRAGIAYDSAKVQPLTSWSDLWREDLKGMISVPGITTTAGPMVVIRAGIKAGTDALVDDGPAFAAIEALKANIVKTYNTGSEATNLVSTGEVSVLMVQDFVMSSLRAAVPTMTWATLAEGDIATLNTLNIPKGAANVELAHRFIDFMLSKEVQQIEAEQGVDAPVRTDVVLTPEQAAVWTYGEAVIAGLQRINYAAVNVRKKDWIERWNEMFGM